MYPTESRIDTHEGTWLHCSIDVPVPVARAFEEVATAEGISAWFDTTSLEPRVGGRIMHFADPLCTDEATASGEVIAYTPPSGAADGEFAWVERNWMGEGFPVPEWTTELRVSALEAAASRTGEAGSRVTLRSGMPSSAALARTSVGESELTWRHALMTLAHRLSVFPEGRVRVLQVHGTPSVGTVPGRWSALVEALGMTAEAGPGAAFSAAGIAGTVIDLSPGAAVFAVSSPAMGALSLFAYPAGDDAESATERCAVALRFTEFAASAEGSDWEAADWAQWLESVAPTR